MEPQTESFSTGPKPCYAGFTTFKNVLAQFAAKDIPHTVDSSVLRPRGGSVISQLKVGFRFFELVDSGDVVTDRLKRLVQALGTDSWGDVLEAELVPSYERLVADLDFMKGTSKQLASCFEAAGVNGTTKRQAIRFYLDLLKEAGIEHSPYFKAPPRPPRAKKSAAESVDPDQVAQVDVQDAGTPSEGMTDHPFNLPHRSHQLHLVLPENITSAEWEIVSSYIQGVIKLQEMATE